MVAGCRNHSYVINGNKAPTTAQVVTGVGHSVQTSITTVLATHHWAVDRDEAGVPPLVPGQVPPGPAVAHQPRMGSSRSHLGSLLLPLLPLGPHHSRSSKKSTPSSTLLSWNLTSVRHLLSRINNTRRQRVGNFCVGCSFQPKRGEHHQWSPAIDNCRGSQSQSLWTRSVPCGRCSAHIKINIHSDNRLYIRRPNFQKRSEVATGFDLSMNTLICQSYNYCSTHRRPAIENCLLCHPVPMLRLCQYTAFSVPVNYPSNAPNATGRMAMKINVTFLDILLLSLCRTMSKINRISYAQRLGRPGLFLTFEAGLYLVSQTQYPEHTYLKFVRTTRSHPTIISIPRISLLDLWTSFRQYEMGPLDEVSPTDCSRLAHS